MITLTTEQAQQIEEALVATLKNNDYWLEKCTGALDTIRAARAQEQAEQEPGFYGRAAARLSQRVKELELEQSGKWRDHVEHRMLTWKTSHMNESGDQLSLKDFMDEHILDDLIDFVCDEYTARTKDLTDDEIEWLVVDTLETWNSKDTMKDFARAVIAADREKNK